MATTGSNTIHLILEAYSIREHQISGLPPWANSDRFDFEGKAEGVPPEADLRKMLQTFLADRFGLAMHRESREITVLVMTVAKGSLTVPEIIPGHPFRNARRETTVRTRLFMQDMEHFARLLSLSPGNNVPVLDKTGLSGSSGSKSVGAEDDDFLPSVAREFG